MPASGFLTSCASPLSAACSAEGSTLAGSSPGNSSVGCASSSTPPARRTSHRSANSSAPPGAASRTRRARSGSSTPSSRRASRSRKRPASASSRVQRHAGETARTHAQPTREGGVAAVDRAVAVDPGQRRGESVEIGRQCGGRTCGQLSNRPTVAAPLAGGLRPVRRGIRPDRFGTTTGGAGAPRGSQSPRFRCRRLPA